MIRLAFLAAFLATTCQVGPFKDPQPQPEPEWPVESPPLAAAGANSCASAIENTKRLGCGFEADDAGAWCATRSAKEVACMGSPKTTSCLAMRLCTEGTK